MPAGIAGICVEHTNTSQTLHATLRSMFMRMLQTTRLSTNNSPVIVESQNYKCQLQMFDSRDKALRWLTFIDGRLPESLQDGMMSENQIVRALTESIEAYVRTIPRDDYIIYSCHMLRVLRLVQSEIARHLEEPLNDFARSMPRETYQQKKELAKVINADLRALGLALMDPATGNPCLLVGDPGNRPEHGRFVLDYTDAAGRRMHALTSVELPDLKLMPDDLSRAPYGSRSKRSR
ncbi:MAG: hypothetical protein AB7V47_07260 [Phycisphaerales bacterium]